MSKSSYTTRFESAWKEYPRTPNMSKLMAYRAWIKETPPEIILECVRQYKSWLKKQKDHPVAHMATWINQRRWEGFEEAALASIEARRAVPVSTLTCEGSPELRRWQEAVAKVQRAIGLDVWGVWFSGAELVSLSPPVVKVGSQFRRQYVESKFREAWASALPGVEFVA